MQCANLLLFIAVSFNCSTLTVHRKLLTEQRAAAHQKIANQIANN